MTVVVEFPEGSRNEYEMDRATGHIVLDRMLFSAMRCLADYGFTEGTRAGDGVPLTPRGSSGTPPTRPP